MKYRKEGSISPIKITDASRPMPKFNTSNIFKDRKYPNQMNQTMPEVGSVYSKPIDQSGAIS
jgi:hypothetical protein